MTRTLRVAALGALACAAALATRLPAATTTMVAGLVLAVGALAAGIASRSSPRTWLAPLAMGCAAALLLVPAGTDAWLDVPAALAVAPMLAWFHALLQPHGSQVPRLASDPPHRIRHALALTPWLALALVAATTPLWSRALLPARLGLSTVAQGPAGPIVAALLLGCAAVAYAFALRAARRPAQVPTPEAMP